MISDLMLYSAKVALLIGLAALALERVAAWRGLPRRALWAAALVLSLALPGSAQVQVTDQTGKSWKIVLHPERLAAARS